MCLPVCLFKESICKEAYLCIKLAFAIAASNRLRRQKSSHVTAQRTPAARIDGSLGTSFTLAAPSRLICCNRCAPFTPISFRHYFPPPSHPHSLTPSRCSAVCIFNFCFGCCQLNSSRRTLQTSAKRATWRFLYRVRRSSGPLPKVLTQHLTSSCFCKFH